MADDGYISMYISVTTHKKYSFSGTPVPKRAGMMLSLVPPSSMLDKSVLYVVRPMDTVVILSDTGNIPL